MDLEDPDDFKQLATLVKGFSNDTRLALLLGIYHGHSANDIADFLDMTRGGLQNNITKMIAADLVKRPTREASPTYQLTPLGRFFAHLFDSYGPLLLHCLTMLEKSETQVTQELADSPLREGLSKSATDKLIHNQKWTATENDITLHLGQPHRDLHLSHPHLATHLFAKIIEAIADHKDAEPADLPPLSEHIDIEALLSYLDKYSTNSSRVPNTIGLSYFDTIVTIHLDEDIAVEITDKPDSSST